MTNVSYLFLSNLILDAIEKCDSNIIGDILVNRFLSMFSSCIFSWPMQRADCFYAYHVFCSCVRLQLEFNKLHLLEAGIRSKADGEHQRFHHLFLQLLFVSINDYMLAKVLVTQHFMECVQSYIVCIWWTWFECNLIYLAEISIMPFTI